MPNASSTRRDFLQGCCGSLACLPLLSTVADGEDLEQEPQAFICQTIEPALSEAELKATREASQSDSLTMTHEPLKSSAFQLSPFGTAFLKDAWLQSDLPQKDGKLLIKVAFLSGSNDQHTAVATAAAAWLTTSVGSRFAFEFGADKSKSVVRVDFAAKGSNWSYVGRDNLMHGRDTKTMNIEWLSLTAVQHEFGHVLGLRHEHQFPGKAIRWHREFVIEAMKKRGWKPALTEEQIFTRFDARATCIGDPHFNPKSVMLYPIAPGWAEVQGVDGIWRPFVTDGYNTISPGDVACLRGLYRI